MKSTHPNPPSAATSAGWSAPKTTTFTTVEQALQACEEAGLEPLCGPDHQFGTKYAVCPPKFETYINCYGDQNFLDWCNAYFRMVELRKAAGWTFIPPWGWRSPDGMTEEEWAECEWPLPEDGDFAAWFSAGYHYDACDEGVEAIPYLLAPAQTGE